MSDEEMITIGITCYNAAYSIEKAIQSAIYQDYQNKEILIVDDCSDDNSISLIKFMVDNHPQHNIRLIKHSNNQGVASARNTLIDNAQGKFIAFFDDDDVSLPDRVRTQLSRIVSYEQAHNVSLIACYASGRRVYPNSHAVHFQAIGCSDPAPSGEGMAERLLYFGGPRDRDFGDGGTPTCSMMARVSTFSAIGGFDANFKRNEDTEFAVRLALKGGHFIGCPEELLEQHVTHTDDKSYDKILEAYVQKVEKHKAFLKRKRRYYYALNWPKLRYHYFRGEYLAMINVFLKLWLRYPLRVPIHFLQTGSARLMHDFKTNWQRS